MSHAIEHLRHLSDTIGPRPATTDAEAEAADYIESVFRTRAVEIERQEFDSPRTYSWAYAIYHLLTIAAAVASGWEFLRWPAFAVAALTAFLMWMDLDTRFGLSGWLPPKGPSQNVIARHVPRARRGERPVRVVIVAHYDSARASLAFAPSMVKNFSATFALMKGCTFAVPALALLGALPLTQNWDPWLWYVTIAASAYLLVPLLINVHREIAMGPTEGANDNASGVAVMLDVLARVTEPAEETSGTGAFPRIRRDVGTAYEAGVVPAGAEIEYIGAESGEPDLTTLPDDFRWAETPRSNSSLDTVEFDAVGGPASSVPRRPLEDVESDEDGEHERRDRGRIGSKLKGLLGGRKKRDERDEDIDGWLGIGGSFDPRNEGRKIGSWENFAEDDDDDGFGFKGGRASDDPLGDPEYAAAEASRIRRRVTERVDRALADKEIWFVATGSEEVGTRGMQALIAAYPDELRRALIINLDNLGAGTLHMVTEEGMARRYRSDRRLLSAGKRVASENGLPVRARAYKGLSTDATPALARRMRAMSVMAFDVNGRLPNWHWETDTVDNISEDNLENAARFVTELVRAL
ncbi:MAG: M28 family peptidase [Clostridiales bacterium]|nr:M28 family peptidase [Clostridiales bacterium]